MTQTTNAIRTVGVIGAGRMGQPIIGHMVRKGFTVRACDTDREKQKAVLKLGGAWAGSAAELATGCDAILLCVGYDRDVRELLSPAGLLGTLARGTIVAVLSTVHPRTVQEAAEAGRRFGVDIVDSTVARGGAAADAGTLLAFVGGDPAAVDRLTPVLSCFAADIVRTGGVGTAQVAKAANNLVMWACVVANHEALALATRYGLDVEELRGALLMSSAENYALRHWGENTMAWAEDDMDIVQKMAQDAGIALPQSGLNRELCRALKPRRFRLEEYGV